MREKILRDLASRAATDPTFLRQARQDLHGTLARHGYRLTGEEARLVEGDRSRHASTAADANDARTANAATSGVLKTAIKMPIKITASPRTADRSS